MRKVLTDKPVWRRRIRLLKCPWDAVLSPRFPSPSRGGVRGGVNFSPAPPPRATILPHPCPLPFEGRGKEACPRLPFPSSEQSRKSARGSPSPQGEGLGVGSVFSLLPTPLGSVSSLIPTPQVPVESIRSPARKQRHNCFRKFQT